MSVPGTPAIPDFDHIFVIIMENHLQWPLTIAREVPNGPSREGAVSAHAREDNGAYADLLRPRRLAALARQVARRLPDEGFFTNAAPTPSIPRKPESPGLPQVTGTCWTSAGSRDLVWRRRAPLTLPLAQQCRRLLLSPVGILSP